MKILNPIKKIYREQKNKIHFVIAIIFLFEICISSVFCQESTSDKSISLGEVVTVVEDVEKVALVITASDIKKSTAKDLSDLLREKGLLVMSSGGSGTMSNFSFKGYADFCCKVYIDGVLATQPGSGAFDWNSIDINSIESVTVLEIPEFSTDQFAGCIVNIKTRLLTERGFQIKTLSTSYEGSNFDTISLFGEYRDTIARTGIKLNAQIENAKNNYKKKKNLTLKDNWAKLANISGSFNSALGENATLNGTSRFFFNRLRALKSVEEVGIQEDFNSFQTVKARFVIDELAIFCASLTSQFNSIEYDETKPDKNDETKIEHSHTTTKMHRGELLFTGENFFGANFSSKFVLESKITGKKRNRFYNSTKFEWSKKINDWFNISPSVGLLVSTNGDLEFLPQITLASKKTGFALSAFRQFILPTFNQLYWDGSGGSGNEDLKSEKGWAIVASWKSPFFALPLSLTYTVSRYENKIRWVQQGSNFRPKNDRNGNFRTFEARFQKTLWIFDFAAGVTNTKALLEDNGKQIMWVPEWQANASFTARLTDNLEFQIAYAYTGERPQDENNLYYYNAVNNLDLNLRWNLLKNATLLFSIKNFLDERNEYHDSYPMPSRAIIAGIKVQG
ncbi:TonB-dependent receptor domain-containing protein [Treponema pectinovorum]|uniref:TonB-dependent receptor domain-containing protein n=1 Tax=Treponema pectinovorum TaxID=164 RepID=UPI0011CB0AF6|nr:TonB-dependent receptor [Treponema pectinovorum]